MWRIGLLIALFLVGSTAFASTDDTKELLQAKKVNNFIELRFTDGPTPSFQYVIDGEPTVSTSKTLSDQLVVTADDQVNITIQFLNPLKYHWTSSEQVDDDPTYVAASKFASAVNTLAGALGSPAATSSTPSTGTSLRAALTGMMALDETSTASTIEAPSLMEWEMWISQHHGCVNADEASKVSTSDADLYLGPAGEHRPASTWAALSNEALNGLLAATNLKDFRAALGKARETQKQLEDSNNISGQDLDALKTSASDLIKPISDGSFDCTPLKNYTANVMARYIQDSTAILATRKAVVDQLKGVLDGMDGLLATAADKDEDNYFKVTEVLTQSGKEKTVSVTIQRRTVAPPPATANVGAIVITDKDALTVSIKVRPYMSIIPEFAPGIVYTNLTHKSYGVATSADFTTVSRNADQPIWATPVAMLNLIPQCAGGGWGWFTMQLGVGADTPIPLLLAGVGIRFTDPALSLTAGGVVQFIQTPRTLNVGDRVPDINTLNKDLQLSFAGGYYIGIQRGF